MLQVSPGFDFEPHHWEKTGCFNPEVVQKRHLPVRYVNVSGQPVGSIPVNTVNGLFDDSVENVLDQDLVFLDPDYFIAGNVHNRVNHWKNIIPDSDSEAMDWIENQVDINKFMTHFKGEFNGVQYDHSYPPARIFRNASNCKRFVNFIDSELTSRHQIGRAHV